MNAIQTDGATGLIHFLPIKRSPCSLHILFELNHAHSCLEKVRVWCLITCVACVMCVTCVTRVNDLPGLEEVLTLEVEWRDRPHSLGDCLQG